MRMVVCNNVGTRTRRVELQGGGTSNPFALATLARDTLPPSKRRNPPLRMPNESQSGRFVVHVWKYHHVWK